MKDSTIYLVYNTHATDVKVQNRPVSKPNGDAHKQPFQEYIDKDEFTITYGDDDNRESTDIQIFSKTKLRDRPKTAGALNKQPKGSLEGVFIRRSKSLSKIDDLILVRRSPLIKPLLSETEIIRLQNFQDVCKQKALELKKHRDLRDVETEAGQQSRTLDDYGAIKDIYGKYPDGTGKGSTLQIAMSKSHGAPARTDDATLVSAKQIQDQRVEKSPKYTREKGLQKRQMGIKGGNGVSESRKIKTKRTGGKKEDSKKPDVDKSLTKRGVKTKGKEITSFKIRNKVSSVSEEAQKRKNERSKSGDRKALSDIQGSRGKEKGSKTSKSTSVTSKKGPKSKGNIEGERSKSKANQRGESSSKYKSGEKTEKQGGKKSIEIDKMKKEKSLSRKRGEEIPDSGAKDMIVKLHGDKVKSILYLSGEKNKKGKKGISDKFSEKSRNRDQSDDKSKKGKKSLSDGFAKTSVTDDGQSQRKSRSSKVPKLAASKTTDKSNVSSREMTRLRSQSEEKSSKTKKDSRKKGSKFSSLMQNMIHYVLSNQVFLKMGWTLQPSDKTMSRVVTFKTRPANPDLYCFRVNNKEEMKLYPSGQLAVKIKEDGTGALFYPGGSPSMVITKGVSGTRLALFSDCKMDPLNKESFQAKVIGIFDCFGNGAIYDLQGKKILNYNQLEGVFHSQAKTAPYKWRWTAYETLRKQFGKELLRPAVAGEQEAPAQAKRAITGDGGKGGKSHSPERKSDVEKAYEKLLAELPRPLESKLRVKSESRFKPFKPIIFKINDAMTLRINGQSDVIINFSLNKFKYRIDLGVIVDPENVEKIEELRSDQLESVTCVFNALKTLSPSLQDLNKQIKLQSNSKGRFSSKKSAL